MVDKQPRKQGIALPARAGFKMLALAIAGFSGIALIFYVNPTEAAWLPPCPFFALTGLYCPLCGSTRAAHQLLHGNLESALHLNALFVLLLPLLLWFCFVYLKQTVEGKPLPGIRVKTNGQLGILAILLIFTVVRNIPTFPFTLLTP